MTRSRYLVIILIIGLSISILAGQELNQLSIVGKATRAQGEIVPGDKLDADIELSGNDVPEGMVYVERGTFQMGSNSGEEDEKPMHSVTVSDFYIGKYEVTQGDYKAVTGKNPSRFTSSGNEAPVERLSWYDAVEFCNKLSDKDGLDRCYSGSGKSIKCNFDANGYRLPTEAEWEYAAKGGNKSKGYEYSGSNTIEEVGWYSNDSSSKTHPVGGKKSNELGIYDMSGNVWEWCWDWFGDYVGSAQTDPKGPASGSYRVRRGDSWFISVSNCRVANRNCFSPDGGYHHIGFRLARSSK
jgi:formylglycine-generating enzyme required for sulfatase activity